MLIDILCRVVDNLGDIGFVYRLARSLSGCPGSPRLRLIVDDLSAFAGICPGVDPASDFQTVEGWTVARWVGPGEAAVRRYRADPPRIILECYACGRPDWFEAILFDATDPVPRHIVNLEYLTAEPWARDFHLLPSLTRSPLVRKTVFMPGFEAGTGGLLLDPAYENLLERCATRDGKRSVRRDVLARLDRDNFSGGTSASLSGRTSAESFWVPVFSYEHDFAPIVADLARFHEGLPVLALVAAGRSSALFLDAWRRAGSPFPVLPLPLLPQPVWDGILAASDFSVIRGEETFARACLAGRPFLWQCYPFADGQTSGGQIPKVHAFLDLVKPYLPPARFADYERLTLAFNGAPATDPRIPSALAEKTAAITAPQTLEPAPGDLFSVLSGTEFPSAFALWALDVRKLGNLAANLMTFLRDLG